MKNSQGVNNNNNTNNKALNNAVRKNYIKVKIDDTQKNSESRLCGDRDETAKHIIRERSKLA